MGERGYCAGEPPGECEMSQVHIRPKSAAGRQYLAAHHADDEWQVLARERNTKSGKKAVWHLLNRNAGELYVWPDDANFEVVPIDEPVESFAVPAENRTVKWDQFEGIAS